MYKPLAALILLLLCAIGAIAQTRIGISPAFNYTKSLVKFELYTYPDPDKKKITVRYRPLEANNNPVYVFETVAPIDQEGFKTWVCEDVPWPNTDAECTAPGAPSTCCTAAGAGSCDETFKDPCFSAVYGYLVQSPGDTGRKLGELSADKLITQLCRTRANGGVMPGSATCVRE